MEPSTLTQEARALKGLRHCLPAILALAAVLVGACGGGPALSPDVKRLVGDDDGVALAIFYGAELMGSVDGCGCFGNAKAGGPPYRFGYEQAFEGEHAAAAVLSVDAGEWTTALRDRNGEILEDLEIQNEWVVRVLDRFEIDAVNVTARDADFLAARYLRPDAWEAAVAERPALARFVSANLRPARQGVLAPPAYVVRSVEGTRLRGGRLRVAIAGVTEDAAPARQAGFDVVDPATALADVLPKARAESDFVVVLAYLSPARVAELARRLDGLVDLYVVAHPTARDREPELGAPPLIAYARYRTQLLGELHAHFGDGGVEKATNRYVPLEEPCPRHPEAERLAAEAHAAVKAARTRRFERNDDL
jgi:hypothetical protein